MRLLDGNDERKPPERQHLPHRKGRTVQLKIIGYASRCACGFAAVLAILFGDSSAQAQTTYTWSGTSSVNWSDAANWGGTAPGSGDIALFNGSTYTYQPTIGSSTSVGGLWDTGSSALAIGGAGTLTLNAATINGNAATGIEMDPGAGPWTISAPIALGAAQTWINNSASLLTVSNVANGGNLLTFAGSGNATISNALSGSGGLTMNGTGYVSLQGNNINYSGSTTVNSGTLQFYNTPGPAGNLGVASGAVLELYASVGESFPYSWVIPGPQTITGAGILRKTGAAELQFGNVQQVNMSGGTIDVEQGILMAGQDGGANFTNNKASLHINAGATFDLWDAQPLYVDALTGSGAVTSYAGYAGGPQNMYVGVSDGSGTFYGTIFDERVSSTSVRSISLTKNGAGIEVLAGSNAYSGGTTVNAGVLTFASTAAQPSAGTTTVAAGATLGLGVGGAGYFGSAAVDALFAGTLPLVNNNATSNVGIDTTAGNFTYSSNISTAKGLTKLGGNMLTLSGNNAYAGPTTIAAGTLQYGALSAIPSGAGYGNVTDNGTLDLAGFSPTINGLSGSGTIDNSSGAGVYTLTVGANNQTSAFSGVIQNSSGIRCLDEDGHGRFDPRRRQRLQRRDDRGRRHA